MLTRPETVTLLRRRIPELDDRLADQLATELGDLPLAAAQAAAYLEQTGLPPGEYLHRFRTRRASLLAKGEVLGYQGRVDTTWTLSLERLRSGTPAAVPLLELAAFLAPEPIPLRLFTAIPSCWMSPCARPRRTPTLSMTCSRRWSASRWPAASPTAFSCTGSSRRSSARSVPPPSSTPPPTRSVAAGLAHPGSPNDPASWSAYAELAPHVLAASPLGDDRADSRRLMLSTVDYLNTRGHSQTSRLIAQALLDRWRDHLGPAHPDTLRLATVLTFALAWLGEHEQARALGQDTGALPASAGPQPPPHRALGDRPDLHAGRVG